MCSSLLNFLRRLVFTLVAAVIGQNCFCFCLFVSFFFLLIIPIDFFLPLLLPSPLRFTRFSILFE